jgi:hypothetical protein
MGFFKQMKDMKAMVHAAPEMIQNAQQMGAYAQQNAMLQQQQAMAAQQAAFAGPSVAPGSAVVDAGETISGVSLAQFAEVSRGLQAYNYDQSMAVTVAASHGIMSADWEAAMAGWNARIQSDQGVAKEFNRLYMGR